MNSEYTGPKLLLRLHELRAIGPRRCWWRAGYELKKRLGVHSRPRPVPLERPESLLSEFSPRFDSPEDLLSHFRAGGAGRFFLDRASPEEYARAVRRISDVSATLSAAEEAINRRFILLGRVFDFSGTEIDWHLEPVSGRSWPLEPWHKIDIRSENRLGDVKFTWELNRHQFWPTLGRAYWLSGDERYAREWLAQLESWVAQNPPETGVNWYSNLEHALRIVSWWLAAGFFLKSPHVNAESFRKLLAMLIAKARHIVSDLDYSRVNMANNHLIGDAMGLALLGMAVPELKESAQWRKLGLAIMAAEADRQIHPDGASFECSASYHRFVMHFYTLIVVLADMNEVSLPEAVRTRLEKMAEFVAWAIRHDGMLPQFGDWDDGLGYRLDDHHVQDFRPLLSTQAVLFGRSDFKAAAGRLSQEAVWLLGPEAVDAWDALGPADAPGGAKMFTFGGCGISRSPDGRSHLFIRNGPFTSHAQADLLSLSLHHAGRPLLVHSGTFTYNGDWGWRTYFRSTRSKNTVTVDDRGQALAHRAFRFLFAPEATNLFFAESPFVMDGMHDGYKRLGVIHRRAVLGVMEGLWLVLDRLTGRGTHEARIGWQLAGDLEAEADDRGDVTARRDSREVLSLSATATSDLRMELLRGRESPPAGWVSPSYGLKSPAWQVLYSAKCPMPLAAATVIGCGPGVSVRSFQCEGPRFDVGVETPHGRADVSYSMAEPSGDSLAAVRAGRIVSPDGSEREIEVRSVAAMAE